MGKSSLWVHPKLHRRFRGAILKATKNLFAMKKMFLPAIIILIIAAGSCSDSEVGSGENKPCILSKEDSLKLASWNRLFGSEQFAKPKMLFARPVLPRHANECVKQYQIVYEKPDCEAVAAAYTEGVSFFGDELQEWLLGMEG